MITESAYTDLDLFNVNGIYLTLAADYNKAKDMYDVSKMDDIWFESVLNEAETYRNGVAVLMDVKGYDYGWLRGGR